MQIGLDCRIYETNICTTNLNESIYGIRSNFDTFRPSMPYNILHMFKIPHHPTILFPMKWWKKKTKLIFLGVVNVTDLDAKGFLHWRYSNFLEELTFGRTGHSLTPLNLYCSRLKNNDIFLLGNVTLKKLILMLIKWFISTQIFIAYFYITSFKSL